VLLIRELSRLAIPLKRNELTRKKGLFGKLGHRSRNNGKVSFGFLVFFGFLYR
jgi:hypothetical protein